jgi:hypothetical protein
LIVIRQQQATATSMVDQQSFLRCDEAAVACPVRCCSRPCSCKLVTSTAR